MRDFDIIELLFNIELHVEGISNKDITQDYQQLSS